MISLIFLVILSCQDPIIQNLSDYPWNEHDSIVLARNLDRCAEIYPEAPCLKYFIKRDVQDYSIICN